MNILYGLYTADDGEILVDGEDAALHRPRRRHRRRHRHGPPALHAGAGLHRHRERDAGRRADVDGLASVLDLAPARRAGCARSPSSYGLHVDPDALVEDLPVGVQQRVEIIKVLFREAQILILDEPTAVLTPQEVERVLRHRARRCATPARRIVFITHKLGEVLRARRPDRGAARRAGWSATPGPSEVDESTLAEMMVGRPVDLVVDKGAGPTPATRCWRWRTWWCSTNGEHVAVDGVSFEVRAGRDRGHRRGAGQRADRAGRGAHRTARAGRPATVHRGGEDVTGASAPRHASAGRGPRARGPPARRPGPDVHRGREHGPRPLLRPAVSRASCDWKAARDEARRPGGTVRRAHAVGRHAGGQPVRAATSRR